MHTSIKLLAVGCLLMPAILAAQASIPSTEIERRMAELQASHISANVPAETDFMPILRRDVSAYLASQGFPGSQVHIDTLRNGPTQSGVSYPKFYLWVRADTANGPVAVGAMRVQAMERVRFEVTDFVTADQVRSNPSALSSVFPAALIPNIVARASEQ